MEVSHKVQQDLSADERKYLQKEYLRAFLDYKNNYTNDIPKDKISPQDPKFELYKCRVPFLNRILTLALDLIHLLGITDPETVVRCKSFKNFVEAIEEKKLPKDMPLTEKDIFEVNIFLDFMIKQLQQ